MNRNDSACDDEQLLVLLRADENSDEARPVASHVQQCDSCQQRLEELAASAEDWDEAGALLAAHSLVISGTGEQLANRWSAPNLAARPVAWNESMAKSLLSPPSHPEMLGRLGRYEIERMIGSGGMGVVFKAYDTELNRPVAVKLLAPYLASSGSARNRFAREARAAAAVVDDHVVPIHNVETDDEHPFLVMKYIAGGSLQQRLDREGPLDVCEVLRIGMQTAKGLAAAHAQGLIHRDVKPSNILLDEGVDRALLTDFGLARATDDASLTRSGFHPGTPHYMSPEQVRGEAIDVRSDLFGLGCVLYAMCIGHPPFRSETSYAVLRRITDDTPRGIRESNPDIPAWLESIVMKLLAKSPDDRFGSAEQVAELLEDCLAHVQQPTTTPLPEPVTKLAKSFGSHDSANPAESLGGFRCPPTGKLIAAAAFGFSLIFAGVLIVLELNKGTLTIESEADDVPIRIMQGDEVVKQLTVAKKGTSVRVASGKYVVLIDGEFSDIQIESGAVTLGRGDTQTIRIVQSGNRAEDLANASDQRLNDTASAQSDPDSLPRTRWTPDYNQPLHFFFDGPEGLKVQLAPIDENDPTLRVSNGPCPCPFKLISSMEHAVYVSNLPGRPDDEMRFSLQVRPIRGELYRQLLEKKQIRVDFTERDFNGVAKGFDVTKVIYLPTEVPLATGERSLETLTSLDTKAGIHVVEAAQRRGEIVAILRTALPSYSGSQGLKVGSAIPEMSINTPTVLASLQGRWQELEHDEGEDFNQTLVFAGGALGQWYRTAQTLPVSITYYVEGAELILQFNHEPEQTFDYRMKQLRFDYELNGDSMSLTRDGITTHFQRIREPHADKKSAQKHHSCPFCKTEKPTMRQELEGNESWAPEQSKSKELDTYVKAIHSCSDSQAERFKFFWKHLEHENKLISEDANKEIALAHHEQLVANDGEFNLKQHVDLKELTVWIQGVEVPASRKRTYLRLLGDCGNDGEADLLELMLRNRTPNDSYLDAVIASLVSLRGPKAWDVVDELILKDADAPETDLYAVIQAVRYLNTFGDDAGRERQLQSLHLVLQYPAVADLVVPLLIQMEDWSQIGTLVDLLQTADEETKWVRIPVIQYLQSCPLPQAKAELKKLRAIANALERAPKTMKKQEEN